MKWSALRRPLPERSLIPRQAWPSREATAFNEDLKTNLELKTKLKAMNARIKAELRDACAKDFVEYVATEVAPWARA